MTGPAHGAPVGLDANQTQAFNDAIMAAIKQASDQQSADGKALTLNALIASLCAVQAYFIAGVEEADARKLLLQEIERTVSQLVAHQRSLPSPQARGRIVTLRGEKFN